jgi:hypothetical protein
MPCTASSAPHGSASTPISRKNKYRSLPSQKTQKKRIRCIHPDSLAASMASKLRVWCERATLEEDADGPPIRP